MAHEHGIVHRDIKPQNILIDARDRFFLSDFGIAVTEFAGRGTAEGTSLGTLHYMSPEQIEDPRRLDPHRGGHRSDIYSFGVVLFEMLTGRLPFGDRGGKGDSFARIAMMHCTALPPGLRQFNPNLDEALEKVVLECMDKNPDNRPQSCTELLQRLEAAMAGGQHPPAYPETILEAGRGTPAATVVSTRPGAPAKPAATRPTVRKRGKMLWLGTGACLIAGALAYGLLSGNRQPQPLPAPQRDWKSVRYDAGILTRCGNDQQCLARKAQSDKLQAVQNWNAEPDDSPLLKDCMGLPGCIDRSKAPRRTKTGPPPKQKQDSRSPEEQDRPPIPGAGGLYKQ
jgi:serine/threonine-protein kinase